MTDPTEAVRRQMVADINIDPNSREALVRQYGQVWDTEQLRDAFTVESFLAPFVCVRRQSDGKRGTLMFQHNPRFYFSFQEEVR